MAPTHQSGQPSPQSWRPQSAATKGLYPWARPLQTSVAVSCEADDLGTFVEDDVPGLEVEIDPDENAETGEVIVLYPGTGTNLTAAPAEIAEVAELDADNRRLAAAVAAAEDELATLRSRVVGLEYGAGIAERHISFLEREREASAERRAELEEALRAVREDAAAARAREHVVLQELEQARADNIATAELFELEHQQAIANERRMHENRLAAAEQRRVAEVAAVERCAAQELAEREAAHEANIAMLEAEHAAALMAQEQAYRERLNQTDLRAAQSLAAQYLILVGSWRS